MPTTTPGPLYLLFDGLNFPLLIFGVLIVCVTAYYITKILHCNQCDILKKDDDLDMILDQIDSYDSISSNEKFELMKTAIISYYSDLEDIKEKEKILNPKGGSCGKPK